MVAVACAGAGWRLAVPNAPAVVTSFALAPALPRFVARDSLHVAVAAVIDSDPFRASRRPATVAYRPDLEGVPAPVVVKPPRPSLVLRGVVGGPSWQAVLEGIPGRTGGVVVRRGDVIGSPHQLLKVQSIGPDTVIIQGADTTWRLTVTRAW
jgi:hypothetical protein